MLGSFDEALTRLRRALRLKPADESILKELDAVILFLIYFNYDFFHP